MESLVDVELLFANQKVFQPYQQVDKQHTIVKQIRNHGGRFLTFNPKWLLERRIPKVNHWVKFMFTMI